MSRKILIIENPNGDTRTAPRGVTFEEFQKANTMHMEDVRRVMNRISGIVNSAGWNHDVTKRTQEKMFYRDFVDAIENGSSFVDGEWYKMHVTAERHHPTSKCPDDVNLIDLIEMIADCVCAGKARSGMIRIPEVDDELLRHAFDNTVDLVNGITESVSEDEWMNRSQKITL